MSVTNFITLATALTNFLLGTLVLGRSDNRKLNLAFALFAFAASFWTLTNYVLAIYPSVFTLETTYAAGALISPFAIYWLGILLNKKQRILLPIIFSGAIISIVVSFIPGSLISSLELSRAPGEQIVFGPGFYVFAPIVVASVLFFFFRLAVGYYHADIDTRNKLRLVILGIGLSMSIILFVIFILPFFGINLVTPIDAQSTLFFVGFSAYAIVRKKFMNVRVFATQLIVAALEIFLLARIFLEVDASERFINVVVFFFGLLIGLLLIRSVMREVKRREEVERLNAQLSDFLRFGTHELRAPLGGIRGHTSMLLDGTYGPLTPQFTKVTKIIQTQVDQLLLLVETFLDANRARSGNLEVVIEPTDIADALRRVLETMQSKVDLKGLHIQVNVQKNLPLVHADPRKMQVVLGNIISNAIKYTQKGSITIDVQSRNDLVHLEVKDTGIGIPASVIPLLFTQFERGTHAAKVMATGSGIGLYLTRKLMDAMDATVNITSPGVDKGTTAHLTFKVESGHEHTPVPAHGNA